ncbi:MULTISPECIES: translation initiation factor IF-2 subunit alpha [Acidiplasma]|jgi:translation initiation factor 2 subunit 1|uniref:Translation initiation factor IF-2 subunit alpha n=3 Tax=Acidiplasma TaxID=507753 RepID=A0A0Q0RS13_9ARCH|nr:MULTISPECIES: translation initiation factor IF-2 subunit alpha [Acidiplasma]KJE48840.1 translation initiation factor IF-2 subunit alpha [Acidiplasma sp. MBA-1]KPV47050.1 translation initiation factor IF-2 subunit alpha [Acidiplasma aeolicum]KQB34404.1 translation initiation factor IF-2 subunit alpha [Acidiplasma aeolicum]KQB35146.1 translation initiation factor IF-2 subunit alpha [Acidiplasma cupricumulans]WMT54236.1 MAG: translation initiation factor IF-2 subunit alpha [Acidiplasma sp.]
MPRDIPDTGDLVVVTVKEVKNYGAIVDLDEYPGVSGFVHITEVATGWIKHIKDYLRVNQRTVCKVLNVDPSRNHVDLSLKRVNEHQKREKIEEWKNEQKAHKLLDMLFEEENINESKEREDIEDLLLTEYGTLYSAFFEAASSKDFLKDKDLKWKDSLIKIAKENIAIPTVKIGGYLEMYSLAPNGIETIKNVLTDDLIDDKDVQITYIGAPRYKITVIDEDYKSAEEKLKNVINVIETKSKKNNVSFEFNREE